MGARPLAGAAKRREHLGLTPSTTRTGRARSSARRWPAAAGSPAGGLPHRAGSARHRRLGQLRLPPAGGTPASAASPAIAPHVARRADLRAARRAGCPTRSASAGRRRSRRCSCASSAAHGPVRRQDFPGWHRAHGPRDHHRALALARYAVATAAREHADPPCRHRRGLAGWRRPRASTASPRSAHDRRGGLHPCLDPRAGAPGRRALLRRRRPAAGGARARRGPARSPRGVPVRRERSRLR